MWFRRVVFQVHLWIGVGIGLYVLAISVSGSVLVYRNELFRAATQRPLIVSPAGNRLTDEQLKDAAVRTYPGSRVTNLNRGRRPNQAVDVWLTRNGKVRQRLFDPYTGQDLGPSVPLGIVLVSGLLDLHDNLLGGTTGRSVNGAASLLLIVLCLTGMVIWWPGISRWRGSVWPDWHAPWKRLNWTIHSAAGFWFAAIVVMWGITGVYLCFPDPFNNWADVIEPLTNVNAGSRRVDTIMYWLAYLHFGRFGGRVAGCGPTCNATFKAVWALVGLMPAVMFATGALIWWNRVLRPRWQGLRGASSGR
jgi:uncharacterized iron-regulated membrane protein